MKTTIIGFVGGPHTEKTTAAHQTTARMKRAGYGVEMAREYVKRWAYEGRAIDAYDELYVIGAQIHEESALLGKVPFVISDRPVLLSIPYVDLYAPPVIRDAVIAVVRGYYAALQADGHRYIHVLLERDEKMRYEQTGRWESLRGAKLIDSLICEAIGLCDADDLWTATRNTLDATIDEILS